MTLKSFPKSGFTLIELLLVVVIIGILAGILLSVINPARQQRRTRESTLIANTGKVCAALFACANAAGDVDQCNDFSIGKIAVEIDDLRGLAGDAGLTGTARATSIPPYASYTLTQTSGLIAITGSLPGSGATGGSGAKTASTCNVTCSYDFADGNANPVLKDTTNCY